MHTGYINFAGRHPLGKLLYTDATKVSQKNFAVLACHMLVLDVFDQLLEQMAYFTGIEPMALHTNGPLRPLKLGSGKIHLCGFFHM